MNNATNSAVIITIDGPSGSGKGTLSQLVARHLGYHLLDSGALYRLVALNSALQQIDFQDEEAVADIAASLNVKFDVEGITTRIILAGNDVTHAIRHETVGMNASLVAAYPKVRAALLQRQKNFVSPPGLVADGRDMGTTVFPNAPVKIFLTASAEARAERRYKQLMQKGADVNLDALTKDIKERDERDTNRAVSPLKPADDALILDSTELSIDEVLNVILKKVNDTVSKM